MSAKLTLEEFRNTRVGEDLPDDEGPAWVYADGSCHIFIDWCAWPGEPFLVIYNMQWADKPLAELEEILYNEFYLTEVVANG